ncbi:DnaJ like protein subfamily A member 2 [Angomonas deanei]|nr:DnaJ like protein subfamily A member 2 [Angomonas deanei]|eukprot:EPY37693.1 DnaJ like protein subfamily A member 2 [Angomonas deanei]
MTSIFLLLFKYKFYVFFFNLTMADMNDILNSFFGGGMQGGGMAQRGRRARDETVAIPASLEDLYAGKVLQIPYHKTTACNSCQGTGSKVKRPRGYTCTACRGSGRRMVVQQMGMMIQQMQVVCDACSGSGESIPDSEKCGVCRGRKTAEVDAPLTVTVEKGMAHGQEIRLRGAGSLNTSMGTMGDVVAVVQQSKHDTFVRKDCDLFMTLSLTLAEALCGFQTKITHLSGRTLIVRKNRGEVTKPGDVQCIKGEGMPLFGKNGKFGDLIIEFHVTYPDRLDDNHVEVLRQALPSGPNTPSSGAGETYYVSKEDMSVLQREVEKAEEVEDEERGSAGGCQAQ